MVTTGGNQFIASTSSAICAQRLYQTKGRHFRGVGGNKRVGSASWQRKNYAMMAKSFALPIKDVSARSRRLKVNSTPGRAKRADLFRSYAFIEKHTAPNKDLEEIPLVHLRAAKPSLGRIVAKSGRRAITEAYNHGYLLHEIAAHWGVHNATVSRRLKQLEQTN